MAALAASSSARPPGHSQLHRLKISNPKISSRYFSMQNILKEEIIWKCRTCLVHFFRHNCWSYFVSSRFLSLHLHHSLYFKFSFFDDFSFLRVNPPSPPQSNYAKNTWGLILLLIIPPPPSFGKNSAAPFQCSLSCPLLLFFPEYLKLHSAPCIFWLSHPKALLEAVMTSSNFIELTAVGGLCVCVWGEGAL